MMQSKRKEEDRIILELKEIASHVTIARARLGMSQQALATKAKLSRSAVSDIERAVSDPSFGTLLRIASALGISVTTLITPTDRGVVDDAELLRRASAGDDEFVDARALHAAIAERDAYVERYSKAGRPRGTGVRRR